MALSLSWAAAAEEPRLGAAGVPPAPEEDGHPGEEASESVAAPQGAGEARPQGTENAPGEAPKTHYDSRGRVRKRPSSTVDQTSHALIVAMKGKKRKAGRPTREEAKERRALLAEPGEGADKTYARTYGAARLAARSSPVTKPRPASRGKGGGRRSGEDL